MRKMPACDASTRNSVFSPLRGQRDGEHALVDVGLDLLAARAQSDLDMRLLLLS